jgi:hypothetical protein
VTTQLDGRLRHVSLCFLAALSSCERRLAAVFRSARSNKYVTFILWSAKFRFEIGRL